MLVALFILPRSLLSPLLCYLTERGVSFLGSLCRDNIEYECLQNSMYTYILQTRLFIKLSRLYGLLN